MNVPRSALLLAFSLFLAGCTGGSPGGVKSINGVARENVLLEGDGVSIKAEPENGTITIGGPSSLNLTTVQACEASCLNVGAPPGFVVAEGSLVSLHNISVNGRGPDRDSAIFFYDDGQLTGQYIQWIDARTHFEVSRDTDVLGNLTARHHVGTVTAVIVDGTRQIQVATAAMEANEAIVVLRGSAALVGGTATVTFPPQYKFLVAGNMTAQVTPTSRGAGLFVSEKGVDHIKVETLDGSASSQTFDYFVQATRSASEDFATILSG